MIKILMDHQMFDMQKFGGISRYFANIYHHLQEDPAYNNEISLLKTDNFYLRGDAFSTNPFTQYKLRKKINQLRYNRKYSREKIGKNDFDIFHPTYYDPYFLNFLKKPFVLTVHDMIHEIYPEFFGPHDEFAKFKRITINKADHIIAISESTKHDLQRFYSIPDEKITVVYHGIEIVGKQQRPALKGINSPYILYVGDRFGYKNFYRFIAAFKEVALTHLGLKLICTGAPFNPVESEFLIRNNMLDRIIQISATDEDMDALYQHALFYISPSLLEGFGFPILEAFGNKCMALLSNTSCYHEIAGEAAIYFDPFSVEQMTDCMLSAVQDPFDKDSLIVKANHQLMKFSMDKSMQKTKDVYRLLLE